MILRPAKPNGTLIVEAPNRGRKLIGTMLEESSIANSSRLQAPEDAGNGFLLSQGYTLAWIGWQADVPAGAGMRLHVPTLAGVTGPSRDEWIFTKASPTERVKLAYPLATQDGAKLTVRAQRKDARATPADLAFKVIDPNTIEITRPAGMPVDAIYEFTYTARDPQVMAIGFAALRDVTAFLARDTSSANPLADAGKSTVNKTIGMGISQSGRLMRDYLYQGFNQDELGRQVFDGMLVQIPGGRRTFTNSRFSQLSRNPGPHADDLYPVDQFPAAFETSTDPLTGKTEGLLKSCRETNTCPRIMQMDSEYEFWSSHASKVVTDGNGRDLPLPAEARAYMVVGTQHFPSAVSQAVATCSLPSSPVNPAPVGRALLTALNAWVTNGTEPPASRYPTLAQGTLVPAQGLYPAIPGLPYKGIYGEARLIVDGAPLPQVKGEYPLLMPAVDKDGNAVGGVRLPIIEAARATYVGWNPKSNNPDGLCTQMGSAVPFAATRDARQAKQDPRLSIEERYPRAAAYEAAVIASANELVRARLLLPEDAKAAIEEARAGKLDKLTK
ncbi:hypothetical protein FXN63_11925 [Pigmentiphaga aceris]|uniref:Alpha/beta hydrolase domain-containing protein n=1 Tax=Pigmentiphaga aceris TaxID=1940612 RepID=A0A5C0B3I2_9BURK|nr:hypothetical protein FXN63_11925 [Pigmentiphaga aceris]